MIYKIFLIFLTMGLSIVPAFASSGIGDVFTSEEGFSSPKNERVIIANADVTARELELLKDLYTSPSVYLYIGDGSNDGYADWLEVTINSGENANNIRKGNMINISITVTLPEHFTITRL